MFMALLNITRSQLNACWVPYPQKKKGDESPFMISIYPNIYKVNVESYGKDKFKQIKEFKYSVKKKFILNVCYFIKNIKVQSFY